MKFGYARISTTDQNLDLQIDALKKEGCEKISQETVSGAQTERVELNRLLEQVHEGDVIVVWKLHRLGRSLKHLVSLVSALIDKGVGLKSLNDPIDTTSSQGRLIFNIFASLAEFERDLIRERTKTGMLAARRRGQHVGRPRSLTPQQVTHAHELLDAGKSQREVAQLLGVSPNTMGREMKRNHA